MKRKAYGKVNIALDVIGKREDGYHLLKMIMQTVDIYDVIEMEKNHTKDIKLRCNKQFVPTDERNLAYKAAKLFKEHFNVECGVDIYIKKNIPVSAGMAGGSTDAATVLYLMNEIFQVKATMQELRDLGLKIGADVPYCIKGGTALCEGVGEKITELKSFKDKILVLVKPPFGVSTKDVYGNLDVSKVFKHVMVDELIQAMEREDLEFIAENMKNILENVTLRKHKILRKIKEDMMEMCALGAMMSGSGPTVFAFFDDMLTAQKCYDAMKKNYKDVFITRTI